MVLWGPNDQSPVLIDWSHIIYVKQSKALKFGHWSKIVNWSLEHGPPPPTAPICNFYTTECASAREIFIIN